MKFYSRKCIKLNNADCHLHYANNKGRGSDNVTVTFVIRDTQRPEKIRGYDKIRNRVIKQYNVSGWHGNVNIYSADIERFGGIAKLDNENGY